MHVELCAGADTFTSPSALKVSASWPGAKTRESLSEMVGCMSELCAERTHSQHHQLSKSLLVGMEPIRLSEPLRVEMLL